MNARHSSETAEHYTPDDIVALARKVLGKIDLDPASCAAANERVRAKMFFDRERDGFTRTWRGRVFLNPPGGMSDDQQRQVKPKCRETGSCGLPPGHHTHEGVQSSQKKWWGKLSREYGEGRVKSAVFVCFSIELLQSAQLDEGAPSTPLDHALCFPKRRVAYLTADGTVGSQPTHASCIVYLGPRHELFAKTFRDLGQVVIARSWALHT